MVYYNDFSFLDAYLTLKGSFLIKKNTGKKGSWKPANFKQPKLLQLIIIKSEFTY